MKRLLLTLFLTFFGCHSALASNDRVALIIGESRYSELGVLPNTLNDARSINKVLIEMGYKTQLVLDASESAIRKSIRVFSAQSEGASIAVVFYAGHGAQVNGENFLLPIDIEIPKRESDIQISAIKVDDIITSLKSKTKVVFLDACRDNPALVKSLSKGRGGYRGGLASAKSSSFDDQSSGIFIAYATDAGNVALDGASQINSPFTTALLKYIKQPVSIDDMFSMVTKDVRLQTKNTQKPYKYASLDGIVCLAGLCSAESGAISIPSSTQSSVNTSKKEGNWILFNIMNKPEETLVFLQPSSIKKISANRLTAKFKNIKPGGLPEDGITKEYGYHITDQVFDCNARKGYAFAASAFDKNDKQIKELVFGNPLTVSLGDYSDPSSLGFSMLELVCKPEKMLPLVSASDIQNDEKWERQYNNFENQWNFYHLKSSVVKKGDIREAIGKYVYEPAKLVGDLKLVNEKPMNPAYAGNNAAPLIKTIVAKNEFNCKDKSYRLIYDNYLGEDNNLAYLGYYFDDFLNSYKFVPILDQVGSFGSYFRLVCDAK